MAGLEFTPKTVCLCVSVKRKERAPGYTSPADKRAIWETGALKPAKAGHSLLGVLGFQRFTHWNVLQHESSHKHLSTHPEPF